MGFYVVEPDEYSRPLPDLVGPLVRFVTVSQRGLHVQIVRVPIAPSIEIVSEYCYTCWERLSSWYHAIRVSVDALQIVLSRLCPISTFRL